MALITLRPGHVQPLWAGHPWVFAQAVKRVDGAPAAGDVVEVRDPKGNFLGRGFYSPDSAIPVRILSRSPDDDLGPAFLEGRLQRAKALREEVGLPSDETNGYRLVHAEGDGLAGLVVDVFGSTAVVQVLTLGMERRKDILVGEIARLLDARSVVEVPAGRAQKLEGIEIQPKLLRGEPTDILRFRERGFDYEVSLANTQKTGFFFDQRDNRALVERLAAGRRVLDTYCYLGGFALAAARGGASEVLAVDQSPIAIARAAQVAQANGLGDRIAFAKADARRLLVQLAQENRTFDLIILDPPKLAPTARHLGRAKSAYRKLNAAALRVLSPGGWLLSCSCSAALRPSELLKIVALAGRDAGRDVSLLSMGQQGMDHPVPAAFPEGRYLKCAVLRAR